MLKANFLLALIVSTVMAVAQAQSATDPDINKKIRAEETEHSQIMHTMHFLTDVYGPGSQDRPDSRLLRSLQSSASRSGDWSTRAWRSGGHSDAAGLSRVLKYT